jgi:type I restriction enzyme S subunit
VIGGRKATDAIISGRYVVSVGNPNSPLPPGWTWVLLSDIAELGTGHTPSRKHPEYWDGRIPWIGIRDASRHHGGVILDTAQHVTKLGLANSAARLLPKDTVCLSRTASIGYVVMMGKPMATSQDFVTWTCGDRLDPSYLVRALIAEGEDIRRFGEGSTHTTIYFPEIKALHLGLPPLKEQQRIVAKIESLSAKSKRASDQLDHIPRLVEKYKQAILAAAFRGDLTREWRAQNPTDVWTEKQLEKLEQSRRTYLEQRRGSRLSSSLGELKELSPLPDNWFPAILADVGSLQVGYAYKSKWYSKEGVRLLRGANIAPGMVTWDDEVRLPTKLAADYSEYVLDAGDIVIAMDRPMISTGLKVARITQADAGALLVQRVARYVPSTFADGNFVWHFINSQLFIEHAVSQSTGSDLPHISSNDILTTPLPLPALQEQREIVRRVEAALAWIDRLAGEAASAHKLVDHLGRAVLAKAFQGELVRQDPSDEPASVVRERIRAEREAMHGGNGKTERAINAKRRSRRKQ